MKAVKFTVDKVSFKKIEELVGVDNIRLESDNDDQHVKVFSPVIAIRTIYGWEHVFPSYWVQKYEDNRITVVSEQGHNMNI